jgi:ATP/maltotriose-dependent transcriptional regulator MalT
MTIAAPETTSQLIERPRLLAELDAAEARGVRAICLVAPAGYGKTVLAEQWVRSRHPDAIWHYASEEARDLAYLALDIARQAEILVPGLTEVVSHRLATKDGEAQELEISALLAQRLRTLPTEPWLVVDDYLYDDTSPSARMLRALVTARSCRLLVTARTRPALASPRAELYEEAAILGPSDLELDEGEKGSLRGHFRVSPQAAPDVPGWPVLARLYLSSGHLAREANRETVFAFVATTVFATLSARGRDVLLALALVPFVDLECAHAVIGDDWRPVLDEASDVGWLRRHPDDTWRMHSLLREFLHRRFRELRRTERQSIARPISSHYMRRREYDVAVAVAAAAGDSAMASRIIRVAYRHALEQGRHAAVREWIAGLPEDSPVVALIQAELDLSSGRLALAESGALAVAEQTLLRPRERHRGYIVAGLAANLTRGPSAETHFRKAFEVASTAQRRSEALWGLFAAQLRLCGPDADVALEAYRCYAPPTPLGSVRYAIGRFSLAHDERHWLKALPEIEAAAGFVEKVRDPRARVGFWCVLGDASLHVGKIDAANAAIRAANDIAATYGLHFAFARIELMRAFVDLLERRFNRCAHRLRQIGRQQIDDKQSAVAHYVLQVMLALARKGTPPSPPTGAGAPFERSQADAYAALAEAIRGDRGATDSLTSSVRRGEAPLNACFIAELATAIAARPDSEHDYEVRLRETIREMLAFNDVLTLVVAYRAWPESIDIALSDERLRPRLEGVLARFDPEAASSRGIMAQTQTAPHAHVLSPREREVLDLLTEGLTNREIANRLFISEATAKLHVRRICGKLGVRSRTEAVLAAIS